MSHTVNEILPGQEEWSYKRLQAKCRQQTQRAVRSGKLRKLPCEACGCPDTEAHHIDYSKPFIIRWLCRKCHHKEHNYLRAHGRYAKDRFRWLPEDSDLRALEIFRKLARFRLDCIQLGAEIMPTVRLPIDLWPFTTEQDLDLFPLQRQDILRLLSKRPLP